MAISDLQAKQGNVDVTGEVMSKETVREFEKFGKKGRVCNAMLKDDSGEIKLSLWNEQVDQVNVGDQIHISNGYVNEWQGEKQLTTGRMGKLEVVGKRESEKKEEPAPEPEAPESIDVDEEDIQD